MQLITKEIEKKLENNLKVDDLKRKPHLKLFSPVGSATWLISEYDKDTGIMFGLCDLGLGFVEFGSVSLDEIKALNLPYGLKIERDKFFEPKMTLSDYYEYIVKECAKRDMGGNLMMSGLV